MFYFESEEGVVDSSTLYITRPNKTFDGKSQPLLVSAEVVFGKIDDGLELLVYESSRLEVENLNGFTSEPIEDLDYFSFTTKFTSDEEEFTPTHAVLKTETSYSIHLTFLQGYLDEDVDEIVIIFQKAEFIEFNRLKTFGDVLKFELSELHSTSYIGDRLILNVA
jgi:hypothetical protein